MGGDAGDGTISVLNLAGKKVTDTLAANVSGANRLKFTPDGKLVFVSSLNGPDVAVFDAATRERGEADSGRPWRGGDPDAAGRIPVFVACTPNDYVAIIDLKTLQVTGHLDAGKQPDGMAWAVRR